MKDELTNLAKKNLKKKRELQTVAITYLGLSIILFIIGWKVGGDAQFWINFPTLIFMFVLAIIYVSQYGFRPIKDSFENGDTELQDEITRLYELNTKGLRPKEDILEEDQMEILELEQLKEKVVNRRD